jgi:hypothetical protein
MATSLHHGELHTDASGSIIFGVVGSTLLGGPAARIADLGSFLHELVKHGADKVIHLGDLLDENLHPKDAPRYYPQVENLTTLFRANPVSRIEPAMRVAARHDWHDFGTLELVHGETRVPVFFENRPFPVSGVTDHHLLLVHGSRTGAYHQDGGSYTVEVPSFSGSRRAPFVGGAIVELQLDRQAGGIKTAVARFWNFN